MAAESTSFLAQPMVMREMRPQGSAVATALVPETWSVTEGTAF